MIIVFWILAVFLVAGFTYFTIRIIIMRWSKKYRRWGRVLTDNLIIEEKSFKISDTLAIKGWSYGSTDFIDYEHKMPGVIVIPRRDRKYPYFEHWAAHFALQGYPTLAIEVKDKKLSTDEFVNKYRPILSIIKEEFIKDKRVDGNKIVYYGIEDSAKVALLEGLKDENVKVVCGISMPKIEAPEIDKKDSQTTIYLVHCKDDKVVPITDCMHNVDLLKIPDDDYIVFDQGGHHLFSQEPIAAAYFSIRVKQELKPIYRQIIKKEIL